jgi:hypothetical protein
MRCKQRLVLPGRCLALSVAIKEREGTLFSVARDPAKTPTGRPSLSMDHNKVQIIVGTIPQARLLLQQ